MIECREIGRSEESLLPLPRDHRPLGRPPLAASAVHDVARLREVVVVPFVTADRVETELRVGPPPEKSADDLARQRLLVAGELGVAAVALEGPAERPDRAIEPSDPLAGVRAGKARRA